MGLKSIFGVVELSYLRWFVDTCLLKIATLPSCIRKFYLESMSSPTLLPRSSRIYWQKFWMLTRQKDSVLKKYILILGANKSLKFLWIVGLWWGIIGCQLTTISWINCQNSISICNIRLGALKQTNTTILQQHITCCWRSIWGEDIQVTQTWVQQILTIMQWNHLKEWTWSLSINFSHLNQKKTQ